MMKKLFTLISIALILNSLSAQEISDNKPAFMNPPVNVNTLFGNEGAFAELLVTKKFVSSPKLGIFSATNIFKEWSHQDISDLMHQSGLTYGFAKGFNVVAGYHYTPFTSFRGSLAVHYTYFCNDLLFIIAPRIDLSKDTNYEVFTNFVYTPELTEKLNLFFRFAGIYVLSVEDNIHQRSYAWLRVGLQRKEFSFGLGANLDRLGPIKRKVNNIGVFLAADLF